MGELLAALASQCSPKELVGRHPIAHRSPRKTFLMTLTRFLAVAMAGALSPQAGFPLQTPPAVLAQQPPASSASLPALDFEFFRINVQPIFLNKRPGNVRCVVCHAGAGRFGLQPLSPGSASWDEEQSHRNFQAVQRLVVPGDPLVSRLLLKPLAEEAGGQRLHQGGKHWHSQDNPEWQALATWVRGAVAPALDFEFFRINVQPIFLNKRPGNVRCVVCHAGAGRFGLQPLSPGSASWDEEQSHRNFQAVQRLVVPGDPLVSRLLLKPLAEEAGGQRLHQGGKHWHSQDDPEWQALATWVRGAVR